MRHIRWQWRVPTNAFLWGNSRQKAPSKVKSAVQSCHLVRPRQFKSVHFFTAPPCGCTNPIACNYEPGATYDDGSCLLPPPGLDCIGACVSDADLDGVCDEDEVEGCTDFNADNYDPSATENTVPCVFYGCVYNTALNFDPFANTDTGECVFVLDNSCPTDVNGDGITAASDILDLLTQYGSVCGE